MLFMSSCSALQASSTSKNQHNRLIYNLFQPVRVLSGFHNKDMDVLKLFLYIVESYNYPLTYLGTFAAEFRRQILLFPHVQLTRMTPE